MSFHLPQLPYDMQALEPYMSAKTLEFHHGKHHQAYVNALNKLVQGTPLSDQPLEEVIQACAGSPEKAGMFNQAAQVWNHTFFWESMAPKGGGDVKEGPLKTALIKTFGDIASFFEQFKQAATTQFGSGWAWLVINQAGDLCVTKTPNADLPLAHRQKALLTCDVWEHAYYLDYQNRRPDYVTTFLEHLVSWDQVERRLQA